MTMTTLYSYVELTRFQRLDDLYKGPTTPCYSTINQHCILPRKSYKQCDTSRESNNYNKTSDYVVCNAINLPRNGSFGFIVTVS